MSGVVENLVCLNKGRWPLLKGDNKGVLRTNIITICTGDKRAIDPPMQKSVHLLHAFFVNGLNFGKITLNIFI